jgi:hypothetical protein
MFCGKCGTQNPDTNQFCKNCGGPLRKPQQAPAPAPQPAAAPAPFPAGAPQPVYQQPSYQQQPAYYPPAAAPVKQPWSRGKKIAVVSFIFGAIALFFAPYIAGIIGIILGAFALKEKEKFGIIGIVIAVIAMAVNFLYIFIM